MGELRSLDVPTPSLAVSIVDRTADAWRAGRFADRLASEWYRLTDSGDTAKAAKLLTNRVELAAATESANAFNDGRAKYIRVATDVELLKVWDATLDKRTCPTCSSADGTIVFARERFPLGEPGSVHPRCRCTWQVLGSSERKLAKAA